MCPEGEGVGPLYLLTKVMVSGLGLGQFGFYSHGRMK